LQHRVLCGLCELGGNLRTTIVNPDAVNGA
jgi:hypothetical protein